MLTASFRVISQQPWIPGCPAPVQTHLQVWLTDGVMIILSDGGICRNRKGTPSLSVPGWIS